MYEEGRTARDAVETAREKIAHLLHAKAKEIYFTSGGTEADNWALQMAAAAGARIGKKHIIVSAIEHHAVLNPAKSLERQGFRVTYLSVTSEGVVLPETLEAAICPDTALVSVMYANNEVGTIQPVEELAEICRMHGVWFHTDAVQAAGHVEIDLTKLQADFLSVSAHKFHGPKGCGFLYVKNGFRTESLLEGGAQEKGKRAGTENVPGIVGMAAALEAAPMRCSRRCGCWAIRIRCSAPLCRRRSGRRMASLARAALRPAARRPSITGTARSREISILFLAARTLCLSSAPSAP